jgi:four helix bundle protein
MEKQKLKTKNNLKYRAYQFSLDMIDFLEILPRNYIYQIIGQQVLRSATSIGANIVEAQAGRTRKDFVNFYHIALKSGNETKYWLAILKEKLKTQSEKERVNLLLQEAIELSKMLGASLITLKSKKTF